MRPDWNSRDREICRLLGTTATELGALLGKTRQTISKHIKNNELFGIGEVVKVASAKFENETECSQVISKVLSTYFPDFLSYGKDFDVYRFSQYYIFGMDVYDEIASNPIMEKFITNLLSDPGKFILFASAPIKPFARLSSWLRSLQESRDDEELASFILIPCKLTELTPVQVLANPWSVSPHLIQVDQSSAFVDTANSNRAAQITNVLRLYGEREAKKCAETGAENQPARLEAVRRLMDEMNSSAYGNLELSEEPLVFFNSRQ